MHDIPQWVQELAINIIALIAAGVFVWWLIDKSNNNDTFPEL